MGKKIIPVMVFLMARAILTENTCAALQNVTITFDPEDPRMAFAAGDIENALREGGYGEKKGGAEVQIVFAIFREGMGPQSFRIRKEGDKVIRVVGGDSLGG